MKIEIHDLYFSYPSKSILKGINMTVKEAEIVCIVGPNGSGKSTLIKCIDTLLPLSKGQIFFDGADVRSLSRLEIAKRIGYVPQSTGAVFSTTVLDTVLMGRKPYSSWKNSDRDLDAVIEILEKLDLKDTALMEFNRLSGGQQQRVLVARALAQSPKALLLDEATSALDIAHQLEIMDVIHSLAHQSKVSVLMIVHDLNLACRYADRIVMLEDGRIRADGLPREVFTQDNILEVYGVEVDIHERDGVLSIIPIRRCSKARGKGLKNEQQHSHAR
jgi:iron complex transport system ATP-binding protein